MIRVGSDLDKLEVIRAVSKAAYEKAKVFMWDKFGLKIPSLHILRSNGNVD